MKPIPTAELLTRLLREAKEAHTQYERTFGPDPDWSSWYGEFIARKLEKMS